MPVYQKLFNIVLNTGMLLYVNSWLIGYIIPIYKNKGNAERPENYRPITILSCMGKLQTTIPNTRLIKFLEGNHLLNPNQAGFRKNHSTIDNIFVLHCLAEYYKHKTTKLFCMFVDFQKAFDSVWRAGLWSKLLKYNIEGKVLSVIRNMYHNIKSCIVINN